MNKERFKSIILMFLVMINFVLGAKILTDKKLWPYGYNFFVSLEKFEILNAFSNTSDKQITKTHLTMPDQIIINTGDQTTRIALNAEDEIFLQICDVTAEILTDALQTDSKKIYFSPKREWVSVLNGKSVCLNYAVPYDTKLMGEFYGVDGTALYTFTPSFSRIAIAIDKSVYFEDYQTGNFYKVETAHNSEKLTAIINKAKSINAKDSTIINYSVDLKFDETFGSQKAVLSPTVPVYSTTVRMPQLYADNPLMNEYGEINKEVIEKLLPIFKINTNTMRRYPEVNGTIVFVENNGILKINPKGILSYQSTDSSGFYLSSGSYIETLSALADFTDRVNDACMSQGDLYVSTPLSGLTDKVSFDYRANGVPVYVEIDGYKNAITAEIKPGALKSYVQVLRRYTLSKEDFETAGYIESLDSAIENYSKDMNNIEISRVFLAYKDDGVTKEQGAEWTTEVKSIEINEEELK